MALLDEIHSSLRSRGTMIGARDNARITLAEAGG